MRLLSRVSTPRTLLYVLLVVGGIYVLLAIPPSSADLSPVEQSPLARPFIWNQDARWDSLEMLYVSSRDQGCDAVRGALDSSMQSLRVLLRRVEHQPLQPSAREFSDLEGRVFLTAALLGACPDHVPDFLIVASDLRAAVKRQSESWDMDDRETRETLYRLLYGTRSALEEVILQSPPDQRPAALLAGIDEPSATPAARLLGVTVHSGDILVSRGGAPTSALIARGNDFPGNFSHIALLHVDSVSGALSIIEAHIERGVTVSTEDAYLRDTKLRVLILRLRSDLPALARDPLLPHRAASLMLRRAQAEHIPYDFAMAYEDTTMLFCSEVASSAYNALGVHLWMGMSYISSPGLRRWLADFGVRYFATQEPSDLEYDPQLMVVGEWRDPETLRKDHIDNAVTEAMLEGAERGEFLHYEWYLLPFARLVKAYSVLLNVSGAEGPIPEGMSAVSALKHEDYAARHDSAVAGVRARAERFRGARGFEPPYWQLLRMARAALSRGGQGSG